MQRNTQESEMSTWLQWRCSSSHSCHLSRKNEVMAPSEFQWKQ